MGAVELRNVRVSYGKIEALHGVTAHAGPGDWVSLVGPNGSGKTTTLRALGGLVPFAGEISIDGRSIASMKERELARSVAFVPQHPAAPDGLRVGAYVLLGRTPRLSYFGNESAEDHRTAEAVLLRLDIGHLADRPLASLSGGERQLVTIARALAQEPSVLLLDEPTSSLDIGRQQEVMELVDELRREDGLTVISAMHDLTQAGQYADSMVLLVRGDQIVSGPVADVLTREHIEEHYRATVHVSVGAGGAVSVSPRRPDRPKSPVPSDDSSDPAPEDSILREVDTPPEEPPVRPAREQASSLVLVNTGDGKGKSTAAFGVAVRAIARDWRVCVIQFLKSGEWKAGEESVLRKLGVDWWTLGDGFTWDSENLDESQAIAGAAWASAAEKIAAGDYDVVILDEVTYPMNWGWIDSEEVLEAIRSRPLHVNVVATGRDAPDALLDLADTATHMVNVHHAYDRGIAARRGIDF